MLMIGREGPRRVLRRSRLARNPFQTLMASVIIAWLKGGRMLIKREVLEAISEGRIDLQFRRWSRPSVKPGGTLKTKLGLMKIGRIDDMRPEDVSLADARRAGFADLADFRKWLDTMKEGPLFQRIEISPAGDSSAD
jgi:hypothetical protein